MHLTRAGYNAIVLIWLVPLIIIDIVGNTGNTGSTAELYYYKSMLDVILLIYAGVQLFRPATTSQSTAQTHVNTTDNDIVGFENVAAWEYIVCALLALYAAANWYFMHHVNVNSTGFVSIASLVWSWLSVLVFALSGIHFWQLKSGAIVELKRKVLQ